jgi:hypothetical protein
MNEFRSAGKLLLVLASTVVLGSESRGTRDHILPPPDSGRMARKRALESQKGVDQWHHLQFMVPKSHVLILNEFHLHNTIYTSSVRTSQETHYVSATKPNRLMLFREIIAVYCEKHTEHIHTVGETQGFQRSQKDI